MKGTSWGGGCSWHTAQRLQDCKTLTEGHREADSDVQVNMLSQKGQAVQLDA